jgi:UDP-sugar transporter A1/2/3
LAVPALIYLLQNALLQWSSGHLSAALWQVTYQGKILVTAAFSVTLLQKRITRVQWLAIALLALGIAIVQLSNAKETKQETMANEAEQDVTKGLLMLLLACCCSGFASVYTEMIFKQVGAVKDQRKKSVWSQNMQLASFSALLALICYFTEVTLPSVEEMPPSLPRRSAIMFFFRGFTTNTWVMAVNNGIGGLLVALVIKCADNILRGFAGAIATINCAIISIFSFGFVLVPSFGLGTLIVIASTLLYGGIFKLPGTWWNSELALCSVVTQKRTGEDDVENLGNSAKTNAEIIAFKSARDDSSGMCPTPPVAACGSPRSAANSLEMEGKA